MKFPFLLLCLTACQLSLAQDFKILNKPVHEKINQEWKSFKTTQTRPENDSLLVLPVVFHIIHQFGEENLSDGTVINALDELKAGFSNSAQYDQGSGIDTRISFCLAKTDPEGNFTTGINHVYADLKKVIPEVHDQLLKSLIFWDSKKYINIWVVKDISQIIEVKICGGEDIDVAGYATLPSSHGANSDGIVAEARNLKKVIIHEMGHYLGLLHTFEGCNNNDCLSEGDMVCDTPPQLLAGAKCNGSSNTCTTDAQSGFTTDVNDLPNNFMDYSSCPHDFTPGQKERMRWMILNVRQSLLNNLVCENNCLNPADAEFTFSLKERKIGDTIHYNNTSTPNSYEWRVNEIFKANSFHFVDAFLHQGWFRTKLLAKPFPDELECRNVQVNCFHVYCSVKSTITIDKIKARVKEPVQFSSSVLVLGSGSEPIEYTWFQNDTAFSNLPVFSYSFLYPGKKFIYLVTKKGTCIDTSNYEWMIIQPLPDYKINLDKISCAPESASTLKFSICNESDFPVPPGLPVSFYFNNPTTKSTKRIGSVFYTNKSIGKYCCENFEWELPQGFRATEDFIFAVVNDNGSLPSPYSFSQFPVTNFPESNYLNNIDSITYKNFDFAIAPKDTTVLIGSNVSFSSNADRPYSIVWSSTTGSFDCNSCKNTSITVTSFTRIIARAMDDSGCVSLDTAIVKIFIDGDVQIPSAFTPNGDDKNDIFYVIGSRHVLKISSMLVFNRWGQKVFEKKNFPAGDPRFGWNGYVNGKIGGTAVYVYYVQVLFLDGSTRNYKGTVTMIQ